MKVLTTTIDNLLVIQPRVFNDSRGYFYESYNQEKFAQQGINYAWIQDNQSKSSYGVIRGLHYQLNPKAQAKLVRVLEGKIFDIAVDIRKKSKTYGKWYGLELSSENKLQLLIPEGFAHGFSVLSPTAIVLYKCTRLYAPEMERGISFADPQLNIDWKIPLPDAVVSDKDLSLPDLNEAENNF